MRFSERVVLVTGAASGIGLATARLFASEGAIVAINDLDPATAAAAAAGIVEAGGKAFAAAADVSDPEAVETMVAQVLAVHGRLDVLVNNAGYATTHPATDYPNWRRVLDINLSGPYYCARAAAVQAMIPAGRGAIVNVASICGVVALPNDVGYVAAKHGVVGLTRALAVEWAPYGIRVNAVGPGFTRTPIVDRLAAADPAKFARRQTYVPMARAATPDEQGKAILYLASDDASYCTGTLLLNDGGQSALHSGYPLGQA